MNPTESVGRKRTGLQILWRWTKRVVVGMLALLLVLGIVGLAYQYLSARRDARLYPPPGKLVDVGGYRLHINSTREGGPTVVLDAGLGGCSLVWFGVQPEVAKFTRLCSYVSAGNEGEKPTPGTSPADWEKFLAIWRDLQADLAKRSTNSIHITAAKSSHMIPLDQPARWV